MKKKLYAIITVLFLSVLAGTGVFAEETQEEEISGLHARSALLMDADSGRVLYEKNGYEPMAMASTTKIMTCIVALENGDLMDEVEVSANAATQPKVHLGVRKGEVYVLEDLLYSLMLESHNDVAVMIAEHIGGSVEGFAEKMNQKAEELGCRQTSFVTPNGLDAEGHQTTAQELALIASYAIQNEQFVEITNTASYGFTSVGSDRSFTVNNKDSFLQMMDGAFGVKTGFTGNAGYCFVGALERDGRVFISVVLASGWPPDKTWKWADTQKLMEYGIENYFYEDVYHSEESFEMIYVDQGQDDYVDTYIEGELRLLLSEQDQVEISYDYAEMLEAPVTADTEIGQVHILLNGEETGSFPIKTRSDVLRRDYKYWMNKVLNGFFISEFTKNDFSPFWA